MVYTLNTLAGECLIVTLKRMKGTRTGDSQPRIQAFHFGFSDLEKNCFFFFPSKATRQNPEWKAQFFSKVVRQNPKWKAQFFSKVVRQNPE